MLNYLFFYLKFSLLSSLKFHIAFKFYYYPSYTLLYFLFLEIMWFLVYFGWSLKNVYLSIGEGRHKIIRRAQPTNLFNGKIWGSKNIEITVILDFFLTYIRWLYQGIALFVKFKMHFECLLILFWNQFSSYCPTIPADLNY
jgi:hypothetical protein